MKISSYCGLHSVLRSLLPSESVLGLLLFLVPVTLLAQEPQRLLLDMASAIETLNYRGTLVYMQPGQADTFRVFHRVVGDQATEKVIALNGDGAEIIRTPTEVICVFPGQRKVVVDRRSGAKGDRNPLRAKLPDYTPDMAANYGLQMLGEDRVANRKARIIAINPADEYRYGYRLWLDSESTMPLKIQLLGGKADMPIEELFFTAISLPEVLEEAQVQPSGDAKNFTWVRRNDSDVSAAMPLTDIRWRAAQLPAGFMETVATLEYVTESSGPRTHLVYSDGLASVSVFVDLGVAASEQVEGLTTIGATNAYSLMVEGFLVTAMGEVPAATVQMIATSMELDSGAAARTR